MAARARVTLAVPSVVVLIATAAGCSSTSFGHDATQAPPSTSARPTEDPKQVSESEAPPADPREITVVMNGDVLLHDGLWASAAMDARRTRRGSMDFRPLLRNMRPVIRGADLAICHLETPLAPERGPYSSYPLFSAPPQIVPALKWAGYDACTTASNHSVDQGFEGIQRTATALDAAGIARTGSSTSRQESAGARFILVKGVEVALIAATYGLNWLPLPEGRPWAVNLIDTDRIVRQARDARRAGAELVLVALHWGDEYVHEPSAYQRDVAGALASSGEVDLIYGHHAHVVQPYAKVGRTWVLYGLGNAVAQQDPALPELWEGNTARVTFEERPSGGFTVSRLEYLPTRITYYSSTRPMRYLDVPRALTQPRFAPIRDQLLATQARVREVIGSAGAFSHGVTMVTD